MKLQTTQLATKHTTANKRTHNHLTETASNHQLFTKRSSNVRTITLLKHTSDSQKTTSRQDTETTLHHSVTKTTETRPKLSKHIWTLKDKNIDHFISWRIISSSSTYNSSSKRCNLCLKEKFFIICRPDLSSLNKRNELIFLPPQEQSVAI